MRRICGNLAKVVCPTPAQPEDELGAIAATWRLRPIVDAFQSMRGVQSHTAVTLAGSWATSPALTTRDHSPRSSG